MTEKIKKIAPAGSVLDKIAEATRRRIEAAKREIAPSSLRAQALGARSPLDFGTSFRGPGWGVIAEVKLASPSQGELGRGLDPVAVARNYAKNGAAAISVLTEPQFFHGSLEDLLAIRREIALPLLMKDFILDQYQLWQARVFGADAVLLIVALIGEEGLGRLLAQAVDLGLTALVEVHNEEELKVALRQGGRLIGINNRDLKSLQVNLDVSRRLSRLARLPGVTLISESGLSSRGQIEELAALGFKGFLIGTHFMRSGRPGTALANILDFAGEGDKL